MGAYYSSDEEVPVEVIEREWDKLVKGSEDWGRAAQQLNNILQDALVDNVLNHIASRLSSAPEIELLLITQHLPAAFHLQWQFYQTHKIMLKLVQIMFTASPTLLSLSLKALKPLISPNHPANVEESVRQLEEAGILAKFISLVEANKELCTLADYFAHTTQFCKRLAASHQTLKQLFKWASDYTAAQFVLEKLAAQGCCEELVAAGILTDLDQWKTSPRDVLKHIYANREKYSQHSNEMEGLMFKISLMACVARDTSLDPPAEALLSDNEACSRLKQNGAVDFTFDIMKKKKVSATSLVLNAFFNGNVSEIYEATKQAGVPFDHIPDDLAKSIYTYVRSSAVTNIRDEKAPWYIDPALLLNRDPNKKYCIVPGLPKDLAFVAGLLEKNPVPGYDLKAVQIVSSDHLSLMFTGRTALLEARNKNKAFQATWETYTTDPQELEQRKQTAQLLRDLAKPYYYERTPGVKYVPLWHGTNPAVLDSVFTTGFANLAKTDAGFFGKGLYSTVEAEYAHRVYSAGALLLNWVAYYSAYPVIAQDEENLSEKGNFENYDAHFVPVYSPRHPKTTNYHACNFGEKHHYTEMVVFESSQMLPHYIVELQPSLPRSPSLIISPPVAVSPSPLSLSSSTQSPAPNETIPDPDTDVATRNATKPTKNTKPTKPASPSNTGGNASVAETSHSQTKPVREWSVDEVCDWVATLDLSKLYTNTLRDNHINGEVLKSMLKLDWQDIGVSNFGDIRVLTLNAAKLP